MLEKIEFNVEKTVLVGVITSQQDEDQANEYLEELAFLAHTAGGEVVSLRLKFLSTKMTFLLLFLMMN